MFFLLYFILVVVDFIILLSTPVFHCVIVLMERKILFEHLKPTPEANATNNGAANVAPTPQRRGHVILPYFTGFTEPVSAFSAAPASLHPSVLEEYSEKNLSIQKTN